MPYKVVNAGLIMDYLFSRPENEGQNGCYRKNDSSR